MDDQKLPRGWTWTTLGALGEWFGGGTPSKANTAYWSGGTIPWVSPKDMKRTVIEDAEDRITEAAVAESSTQLVPAGAVLVVTRSGILQHTVPVATTARPVALNQDLKALVPHPGVLPAYVAGFMRGRQQDILARCSKAGTTVASMNLNALKAYPIPLPPSEEQRRIVAKLDELLASSRRAQAALDAVPALLGQFRQAVLGAAFDGDLTAAWRLANPHLADEWTERTWAEVGSCQNGRAFPSSEYSSSGVRLLRPGNLHVSGRVEWTASNTRCMPTGWADRFPKHVVGPGEILMNLTAQSLKDEFLGRVCMTGPGEPCLLNQRIARLTPTAIDSQFAFWAFKSPRFRKYVDGLNSGSLIQHMFTSQVDEFVLPVPPRAEQEEIVRRIEGLLGRREQLELLLAETSERIAPLEAATLAKAFRGELVAQDPTDEPASVLLDRLRSSRSAASADRRPRRTTAST